MTVDETKLLLGIIKAAYPAFYKDKSKSELQTVVVLWASLFKDDQQQIVEEAVKALMCTLKYPPTIADVKEKIQELTQPEQLTEMEAWNLVKKAMNTSYYTESFRSLPPALQRIVGSPNQLKQWAFMGTDTVNSVIQSNFMRSYKVVAKREREYAKLPESSKQLMEQLTNRVGKMLE